MTRDGTAIGLRGRWVLGLGALGLGACGGGGGTAEPVDAGDHDAAPIIDAAPPDAEIPGELTVTLMASPTAYDRATSRVVFHRADGSVLAVGEIDEAGMARGPITVGGAITVVQREPSGGDGDDRVSLWTILGAADGDDLRVGWRFAASTPFTVTVNAPTYFEAAAYNVFSFCNRGSSGSPTQASPTGLVTLVNDCAMADFLVEAKDAGGARVATLYARDIPVTPNATVTLDGDYLPLRERTYTFTGLPAGATSANVLAFPHALSSDYDAVAVAGGAVSHVARFPDVATREPSSAINFYASETNQMYLKWPDDFAGDFTRDVGATLLPAVTACALDGLDAVTWTQGAGAAPEMVSAEVSFRRPAASLVGTWRIMGAPGASARLPLLALPEALAQNGPLPGDDVTLSAVSLEASSLGDYPAYRAAGFADGVGVYRDAETVSSACYP